MAKKKKAQVAEPAREELSEFAYQPTSAEGLDEGKPFGSQSYKHMKGLLMQRVNPSRYVHSISVAKTARKLARVYGYDECYPRGTTPYAQTGLRTYCEHWLHG